MESQGTNPDLDFILKNNSQAKRGTFGSGIPKPAKLVLFVLGVILILVVVFSVLSGRKSGSTQSVLTALERGQETLRITALASQLKFQDPQTQALAATVSCSLISDQTQLKNYLLNSKTKVSTAQLAADQDKSSDTNMQNASQNNNLDSAYISYLRDALAKYKNDLNSAYNQVGPNGKLLITPMYSSADTLLSTAPLKA